MIEIFWKHEEVGGGPLTESLNIYTFDKPTVETPLVDLINSKETRSLVEINNFRKDVMTDSYYYI